MTFPYKCILCHYLIPFITIYQVQLYHLSSENNQFCFRFILYLVSLVSSTSVAFNWPVRRTGQRINEGQCYAKLGFTYQLLGHLIMSLHKVYRFIVTTVSIKGVIVRTNRPVSTADLRSHLNIVFDLPFVSQMMLGNSWRNLQQVNSLLLRVYMQVIGQLRPPL